MHDARFIKQIQEALDAPCNCGGMHAKAEFMGKRVCSLRGCPNLASTLARAIERGAGLSEDEWEPPVRPSDIHRNALEVLTGVDNAAAIG
jgi:hypothetical protein